MRCLSRQLKYPCTNRITGSTSPKIRLVGMICDVGAAAFTDGPETRCVGHARRRVLCQILGNQQRAAWSAEPRNGAQIKRDSGRGGCEEEAEVLRRASEAKRLQAGRQCSTARLLKQQEGTKHRTPASQPPYPWWCRRTDLRYSLPTPAWRSHSRDRQHSRGQPIAMFRPMTPRPCRARLPGTPLRTRRAAPRTRTASRVAKQGCLLPARSNGALVSFAN